ncbi:MAG: hypothetical protein AABW87_02100, partial [Nanoarchaeota archaeon]
LKSMLLALALIAGFTYYFGKESFYFGFLLAFSYDINDLIIINSSLFVLFNISDSSLGKNVFHSGIAAVLGASAGLLWKYFYSA